jgi:hypothetical protein
MYRTALLLCVLIPGRAATLPIKAYTVADGLAHDHVSKIYRDSQDFLWVCTDDGLSRFDGRRFVNYTTADGLPHIHVNDIGRRPRVQLLARQQDGPRPFIMRLLQPGDCLIVVA